MATLDKDSSHASQRKKCLTQDRSLQSILCTKDIIRVAEVPTKKKGQREFLKRLLP